MSGKHDHVRQYVFTADELRVPEQAFSRPPSEAGIYFLWKDGECVYVGQSRHILSRVGEHCARGEKDFDSYSYVACEADFLDAFEAAYQLLLRPRMNLNDNGVPKHRPMASLWKKIRIGAAE